MNDNPFKAGDILELRYAVTAEFSQGTATAGVELPEGTLWRVDSTTQGYVTAGSDYHGSTLRCFLHHSAFKAATLGSVGGKS